jgi:hypothetical protein
MAMDDFRVGPVPSSEPYGDRHSYDSVARKRHKHHDDQGGQQDEPADTFQASTEGEETSADAGEPVEDYYQPSGTEDDEE